MPFSVQKSISSRPFVEYIKNFLSFLDLDFFFLFILQLKSLYKLWLFPSFPSFPSVPILTSFFLIFLWVHLCSPFSIFTTGWPVFKQFFLVYNPPVMSLTFFSSPAISSTLTHIFPIMYLWPYLTHVFTFLYPHVCLLYLNHQQTLWFVCLMLGTHTMGSIVVVWWLSNHQQARCFVFDTGLRLLCCNAVSPSSHRCVLSHVFPVMYSGTPWGLHYCVDVHSSQFLLKLSWPCKISITYVWLSNHSSAPWLMPPLDVAALHQGYIPKTWTI